VLTYLVVIHHHGYPYHPDLHMRVQPWWSTPAAIVVAFVGIALFTRLLPKQRHKRRPAGIRTRLTT